LRTAVDHLVCLIIPALFHAVGMWYKDFAHTTNEKVRALLAAARAQQLAAAVA